MDNKKPNRTNIQVVAAAVDADSDPPRIANKLNELLPRELAIADSHHRLPLCVICLQILLASMRLVRDKKHFLAAVGRINVSAIGGCDQCSLIRDHWHSVILRNDKRRRVQDPAVLRTFIDAVAAGDVSNLSAAHRDLAARIYKEKGKNPNRNAIMEALVSIRNHEWAGTKLGTFKDNYYRPHTGERGSAPRTQRARKRV